MSSIKSRLNDIPVYERMAGVVDAPTFNQIRLALLRLNNPLRCPLRSLRGLDMLLTDDAWVCVDRTLNDVPVVAWIDFQTHSRNALHEPVACELRYYHAHAHMIIGTLFNDISLELNGRLHRPVGAQSEDLGSPD